MCLVQKNGTAGTAICFTPHFKVQNVARWLKRPSWHELKRSHLFHTHLFSSCQEGLFSPCQECPCCVKRDSLISELATFCTLKCGLTLESAHFNGPSKRQHFKEMLSYSVKRERVLRWNGRLWKNQHMNDVVVLCGRAYGGGVCWLWREKSTFDKD